MEQLSANPVFVALYCALRCLVPLGLMLGLSYLLRRLGVIAPPPTPPPDWNGEAANSPNGGLAHGRL